jgi:hypothetical protein
MSWTPGGWSADEPGGGRPGGGRPRHPDDDGRSRARWNIVYFALSTAVLFVAILFPAHRSGWVIGLAAVAIVVILLGLAREQPSDPWQRRRSENRAWTRVHGACARWAPFVTMAAVVAVLVQSLRA